MSRGPWVLTPSGHRWYPLDPSPRDVHIDDLRALSRICRWGGATREHYSVAEHSVRVADLLAARGYPPGVVLQGLVHDAHEVYPPGDVAGPLLAMPQSPWGDSMSALAGLVGAALRALTTSAEVAVRTALGVSIDLCDAVVWADRVLLATERRDLVPRGEPWAPDAEPLADRISPWAPAEAERAWFARWEGLRAAARRGA